MRIDSNADRRVLVVEDDHDIAELLHIRLELAGHKTRVARNAASAFDLIHAFRPHCLVLDIGLPDQSGLSILRQLRADPNTRFIPVLMLTARCAEKDIWTAIELGAEDYMRKPFDDKQLLRRVARLLDPSLAPPAKAPPAYIW